MREQIKFTKAEMKTLDDVQEGYTAVQNAFGQLNVSRIRLEQRVDELNAVENNLKTRFLEIQNNEKQFIENVNKKYGDGNLDLATGVFTKSEESQGPKESQEKVVSTFVGPTDEK